MLSFVLVVSCLALGDAARSTEGRSGHPIVPTLQPSRATHMIVVPDETYLLDLTSLQSAEHPYPEFTALVRLKQPTEDEALEHSEAFKAAAKKAWASVSFGDFQQEAGFMVDNAGKISGVQLGKEIAPSETVGSTVFQIPPEGIFANLHTHPRPLLRKKWVQQPSQPDIDVAKDNQQNVYVITASGLWQVESDGTVNHVFANNDWMRGKQKIARMSHREQKEGDLGRAS